MHTSSIQLENLGVLPRIGFKGPGAAAWLQDQSLPIPADIFDAIGQDDGSLIVRLGNSEFMIESSSRSDLVARLDAQQALLLAGVYSIPHSEVTLELSGSDADLVFAQTCGIDFSKAAIDRVVYTRVAGVSCGILKRFAAEPRYRIWVDFGFAPYLWETLAAISSELGGQIVASEPTARASALTAH